jgi:hypothetical protein
VMKSRRLMELPFSPRRRCLGLRLHASMSPARRMSYRNYKMMLETSQVAFYTPIYRSQSSYFE